MVLLAQSEQLNVTDFVELLDQLYYRPLFGVDRYFEATVPLLFEGGPQSQWTLPVRFYKEGGRFHVFFGVENRELANQLLSQLEKMTNEELPAQLINPRSSKGYRVDWGTLSQKGILDAREKVLRNEKKSTHRAVLYGSESKRLDQMFAPTLLHNGSSAPIKGKPYVLGLEFEIRNPILAMSAHELRPYSKSGDALDEEVFQALLRVLIRPGTEGRPGGNLTKVQPPL